MLRKCVTALAVSAALGISNAATAAAEDDLKDLREQVRQLRELYERRIEALEKRLRQAEQSAGRAQATASKAEAAAHQATVQASVRQTAENAFNPGISLVLNGVYANLSQNPATYRISGFAPTGGEVGPGDRGLSLGESELAVSANIDPDFRGTLIAALAPTGGAEIEEAYVQTLGLANGLTIKAGRFFSGIGYLNQTHPHQWDFADASLVNKAFLGNRFAEDGLQIKWIAPTDTYFDVGAEFGRGRSFPGTSRNKNGIGSSVLFAHVGGDIGAGIAWQAGLSHLRTRAENRSFDEIDSTGTLVSNAFSGSTRLWVADAVLKWAPNGNPTRTNFKLQGEYFRRREDGDFTYDATAASLGTASERFGSAQSGWYLQGVYQFIPRWRIGYRYDKLNSGKVRLGLVDSGVLAADNFPTFSGYKPKRDTVMLDYSPTEFSRMRIQFARDRSRLALPDNQVFLQYIMSLGAHGAHRF